jgi:hypothetical protein
MVEQASKIDFGLGLPKVGYRDTTGWPRHDHITDLGGLTNPFHAQRDVVS